MSTYITIIDTAKEGWLTVDTNALYSSGSVLKQQLNIKKTSINAVNIVKDAGSLQEFIEVHTSDTSPPYTLSNNTSQSKFYPIESVNGGAPSSLEDLKDKILALI
jgi:hypothetical protein